MSPMQKTKAVTAKNTKRGMELLHAGHRDWMRMHPQCSGCPATSGSSELYEIPQITIEIREYGDRAVVHRPRFANKTHTLGLHCGMIALEIIGLQEQEYTSAGLIANERLLFRF
jgi:hypothetical protein